MTDDANGLAPLPCGLPEASFATHRIHRREWSGLRDCFLEKCNVMRWQPEQSFAFRISVVAPSCLVPLTTVAIVAVALAANFPFSIALLSPSRSQQRTPALAELSLWTCT